MCSAFPSRSGSICTGPYTLDWLDAGDRWASQVSAATFYTSGVRTDATMATAGGRTITTTIRGFSTEMPVGPVNGLDDASVVSCDNILTMPTSVLGRHVGQLFPAQEVGLADAIRAAFNLA